MSIRAAVLTLFLAPLALAQATYSTGFEPPAFTLGDVDGQNGWGHLSNSPTGGAIEVVPAGSPPMFGTQSLAIRTREDAFFGVANHLYSPTIDPAAGETGSTAGGVPVVNPQTHFSATLWYHTPPAPVISTRGDGRIAELNPSSKGSAPGDPANRYAQVRVFNNTNTLAGDVRVEIGWYISSGFTTAVVAHLDWNTWYRFDYLIELVDGTEGAEPNDRFTLTIHDLGGAQLGSACGSTWELGWKSGDFGGGTTPRAINGFDFWSVSGPDGSLAGHLDEMTMTAFTPATALSATIGGNTNVCAGGSTLLTANATVGAAVITGYTWGDASNATIGTNATLDATPGTYMVTVTDALCVSATSAPFTVSEYAPLSVAIGGGTTEPAALTANVSGGSGTIASYEWRNGSNAIVGTGATLQAGVGTYTVTVQDASCGTATSPAFAVAAAVPIPTASESVLLALIALLAASAAFRLR